MATIVEIERSGNRVVNAGQAKILIGDALRALGSAYNHSGLTDSGRRALDKARAPLESWWAEVRGVKDSTPYKAEFAARRTHITRAFVEIAGVDGELLARSKVSLIAEIKQAAKEAPKLIGETLGEVGKGVGDAAGSLAGGILGGLGPVLAVLLIVILVVAAKAKAVVS